MPTLSIDGVGKVNVDDSFTALSPADQQAMVEHIAAQAKAGTSSGAYGASAQPPGPQAAPQSAPAAPQEPKTTNPIMGAIAGIENTGAGIASAVSNLGNAIGGAYDKFLGPDDPLTKYGTFYNPVDGLHFTKTANDTAPDWAAQAAKSLKSSADNIGYAPSVSAADALANPSKIPQALGERLVTALPYMMGGAAAGAGAVGTYGNTLAQRMQNSGETTASSGDVAAAVAPAVTDFAANRLGVLGGGAGGAGVLGGAAKLLKGAAVGTASGAANGAVQNLAETAGTNVAPTASGIANAAAEGGLNGLAMAGASDLKNTAGDAITQARAGAAYNASPEAAASASRVAQLYAQKLPTINNYDPSNKAAGFQVFKSIRQDLHGQLTDTAAALKSAGIIDGDQHKDLTDAIKTAGRQSYPVGQQGDGSDYFDTSLDNVRNMSIPDNTKSTLLNTLRDLNTTSIASMDKNGSGPLTRIGGALANTAAGLTTSAVGGALGGGPGAAIADLAMPLMYKSIGKVGTSAGTMADKALGWYGPQVLQQSQKVAPYLDRQGINPGNTVADLSNVLDAANTRAQAAQQVAAQAQAQQQAQAQAQSAKGDALRGYLNQQGVEPLGGWLASSRKAVQDATGIPVTGDEYLGHLKDLVDAGHLTQDEHDALSAARGGSTQALGIGDKQFYGLQDYVASKLLQQQAANRAAAASQTQGAPEATQAPPQPAQAPSGPQSGLGGNPAYLAQAQGNQDRVTAAAGRVPSYGLAPQDAALVSGVINSIGATNNKADAQAIHDAAQAALKDPKAQAALITEVLPLLAQIRHATPEAAQAARKKFSSEDK